MQAVLDRRASPRRSRNESLPDTVGLWDANSESEVSEPWHERKAYASEIRWLKPKHQKQGDLYDTTVKGYIVFNRDGHELRRVPFFGDEHDEEVHLTPGDSLLVTITWHFGGMQV